MKGFKRPHLKIVCGLEGGAATPTLATRWRMRVDGENVKENRMQLHERTQDKKKCSDIIQ